MRAPRAGVKFTVPAGTPVHSMDGSGWAESPRGQRVSPNSVCTVGEWVTVTWSGKGCWRRVVLQGGKFVGKFPS